MVSEHTQSVAQRARQIYDQRLRVIFEQEDQYLGQYVAIEPESGDHFLANTFDAAADAAQAVHPNRQSHILRVGHTAALHLGGAIT